MKPRQRASDPNRIEEFVNLSSTNPAGLKNQAIPIGIHMCRIVHDYDKKNRADQWYEARLITTEGEKPIRRVHFGSEFANESLGDVFSSFISSSSMEQKIERDKEAGDKAHARLVAYMLQDGWEPSSYYEGKISMMRKRF